MHTLPKINQIYSFKCIFILRRSLKSPLALMTHFQQSGSFLTPSSRSLEFSSRIRWVMAKFRSFKVGKRRLLNGSCNFMNRDSCLENKGVGQHFPHVGVQNSGPYNVSIFTYDLWSCFVMWLEVSVISTFYVQYTLTRSHCNLTNHILACSGDYRERTSIFLTRIESASCRCVHYFWNEPHNTKFTV